MGDLDLDSSYMNQTNNISFNNDEWDKNELLQDNGILEKMEREQKRLERMEKHRLRQLEHERQLLQKRSS